MLGTYAIISPVRNEAKYLPRTIAAMVQQQHRPQEWIIVDDGSSDDTVALAQAAAAQHAWIKVVRRSDRGYREPGRGVVEAFNEGLAHLSCKTPDFICKMDGDLEFGPGYFATLLREFARRPRLGMASGTTYLCGPTGKLIAEKVAPDFVVGPIKLYRRTCFEAIGGLEPHLGWDTIDVYRARMLGWETANYPELVVIHLRQMGSAKGIVWGKIKTGMGDYYYGSHPLFVLARCLYRMSEPPYGVIGCAIGWGYLRSLLRREARIADPEFIRYLRADQVARLRALVLPWKRPLRSQHSRLAAQPA